MKAKTRSYKFLNTFTYAKDLVRKYDTNLNKSPVLISLYAIIIIGLIGNEYGAICIWFLNLNTSSPLLKILLEKR